MLRDKIHVEWLKTIGIDYYIDSSRHKIKHSSKIKKDIEIMALKSSLEKKSSITSDADVVSSSVYLAKEIASGVVDLASLREAINNFQGCSLKALSTNTVFSDGNTKANIMFIGEAPGANEDKEGIPFCGESGKLLDKMLASIGLSRAKNAYITNTVFWRPPLNRTPTQEEIDICKPFVQKHIALIKPKLIVLVGSTAATSLFGKHAGITKIRGEIMLYNNEYLDEPIPTTAIFHPAYLLRQPLQKKNSWFDLIKIQQYITTDVA